MTAPTLPQLTDEDILAMTQGQRQLLVAELTANGVPVTEDDRKLLLTTLADMDRAALGRMRAVVDTKNSGTNSEVAAALAKIAAATGGGNPFAGVAGAIPAVEIGLLPPPAKPILPGELVTTQSTTTYDEFASARGIGVK